MLLAAVVLFSNAPEPIPVLFAPEVLEYKEDLPIAVLLPPDKEPSAKAISPKATLFVPVG